MKSRLKIEGHGIFELRDKKGNIIEKEEKKNTIVNDGLERIAKLLGKNSGVNGFEAIAIGTGESGDSVDATDTSLKNEITRAQADSSGGSYETDYKWIFEKTFTFGSGESYEITEAGIFDSITQSGSTMLDRFTFSGKNVDSEVDLYVKITITVSRV